MYHQNKTEKVNTRSNSVSSLSSLLTEEKASKRARDDQSKDPAGCEIASFDELWSKIDNAIKDSNRRIETKIEDCMAKINGVEEKLAALREECSTSIKSMAVTIDEVRCELSSTNEFVGRLEKSSELIISAVPFVTDENLKNTFEDITKSLGYTSAPLVDLKRMARAPIKPGDSPAIICQFALRAERDAFYRKYLERRDLNLSHIGLQSRNRIYVNENLTQTTRSIRNEALKLKRSGKLCQVFTKEGVVFVKPSATAAAVACHSLTQLENFS